MKVKNLVEWGKLVIERDNHTCQQCRRVNCRMEAHHIKNRKNYPKLALNIANGIALCAECHSKKDRQLSLKAIRQKRLVQTVRFWASSYEKEALEAEAKKLGISVSAFIRLLIKQWSDGIRFEKVGATQDADKIKQT